MIADLVELADQVDAPFYHVPLHLAPAIPLALRSRRLTWWALWLLCTLFPADDNTYGGSVLC